MTDLNLGALSGRVVRDAELKVTGNGTKILLFTVATNRDKKINEKWQSVASFFNLKLFGNIAERLQQYMKKGQQVNLEFHLESRSWEKDGEKRSSIEIVLHNVVLVGGTPEHKKAIEGELQTNEIDITPENYNQLPDDFDSIFTQDEGLF